MKTVQEQPTHECAFYQVTDEIRCMLCPDCANGSKPVRPVKNKQLQALALSVMRKQK